MVLVVAEGAGHAATAGRNDVDGAGCGITQELGRLIDADQRFLVTMTMQPDILREVTEDRRIDATGFYLADEELVVQ